MKLLPILIAASLVISGHAWFHKLLVAPVALGCSSANTACAAACGPAAEICLGLCSAALKKCYSTCFSWGFACFDDNVSVNEFALGHEVHRRVQDVNVGNKILTAKEGVLELTEVVSNERIRGMFEFIEFDVDGASGRSSISVTSTHNMLAWRNNTMKVVQAQDIELGEIMYRAKLSAVNSIPSTTGNDLEQVHVQRLQWTQREYKNVLVTAHGSAFANGLYTTTICDGAHYSKLPDADSALAAWRNMHSSTWDKPVVFLANTNESDDQLEFSFADLKKVREGILAVETYDRDGDGEIDEDVVAMRARPPVTIAELRLLEEEIIRTLEVAPVIDRPHAIGSFCYKG